MSCALLSSSIVSAEIISFIPSGTSTVSQNDSLYWDMLSDSTSTTSPFVGFFELTDHGDFHFDTSVADMVNIGTGTGGYLHTVGEMIGTSSNWSNSSFFVGTTDFSGVMSFGDTGIFGLSFELASGTHYGWVEISENTNGTQSILGWAYESIADKSIEAGVTSAMVPTPSILVLIVLGVFGVIFRKLSI